MFNYTDENGNLLNICFVTGLYLAAVTRETYMVTRADRYCVDILVLVVDLANEANFSRQLFRTRSIPGDSLLQI